MTLDVIAWTLLAAYVVHLLDETLLNGGFVSWVGRSFWPDYTTRMFFWFNAGAVALIATSSLGLRLLGGRPRRCCLRRWLPDLRPEPHLPSPQPAIVSTTLPVFC